MDDSILQLLNKVESGVEEGHYAPLSSSDIRDGVDKDETSVLLCIHD